MIASQNVPAKEEPVNGTSVTAVRALARTPGFTSLAVGLIGVIVALLVLLSAVLGDTLLAPPPYASPEQLHTILASSDRRCGTDCAEPVPAGVARAWRRAPLPAGTSTAIYGRGTGEIVVNGRFDTLSIADVDSRFFSVLGVAPLVGGVTGTAATGVVLSYQLWRNAFGGRRNVIGQTVRVDGRALQVLAVAPRGMRYPADVGLWCVEQNGACVREDEEWSALVRASDAHLPAVQLAFDVAVSGGPPTRDGEYGATPLPVEGSDRARVTRRLWPIIATTLSLLALAAVSLFGLFFARQLERIRQLGLFIALGARARDMVALPAWEAVLVVVGGVVSGILVAVSSRRATAHWVSMSLGVPSAIDFDPTVLIVTAAGAVLLAALAGLAPTLFLLRDGIRVSMGTTAAASTEGRSSRRTRRGVVLVQVVLALVSSLGASAFVIADRHLSSVSVGYAPDDVIAARVNLGRGDSLRFQSILRTARDQISVLRTATTRSTAAAWLTWSPSVDAPPGQSFLEIDGEGRSPLAPPLRLISAHAVTTGFFETLDLPLLKGRDFTVDDAASAEPVAIVNEVAAKDWFAGGTAIGRRVRLASAAGGEWRTVIGVVRSSADISPSGLRFSSMGRGPSPTVFVPIAQMSALPRQVLLVGSPLLFGARASDGGSRVSRLDGPIRAAASLVGTTDRSVTVGTLRALFMDEYVFAQLRLRRNVLSVLAGLSLIIAAIGTGALLADDVARRRQEIAVRMALGASDLRIALTVLGPVVRLLAWGVAVTALLVAMLVVMIRAGDVAVLRSVSASLLGPISPFKLVVATLGALIAIAVSASVVPLVGALRLSPSRALNG